MIVRQRVLEARLAERVGSNPEYARGFSIEISYCEATRGDAKPRASKTTGIAADKRAAMLESKCGAENADIGKGRAEKDGRKNEE